MINFVIFGAPGTGKGTQSAKIAEKYGFCHISTGDVLRAEIRKDSEIGQLAKHFIDKGQLIPDDVMCDILARVYDAKKKEAKGFIFDGFPRTIPQAEALKKMLAERDTEVSAMVDLEVPEDELIARLVNRGRISGRADDNEATIRERLKVYHEQTQPLIEWYKQEGLYHVVDGLGEIDRIFGDICQVIDQINA